MTFIWLAASAWARPLMLPDEGRYVSVAWEMMRSGDWLTPTLNGLPFFHKPPLFYWMTALSMSTFGLHEWAARVAPLLGAWLGATSLYLFIRRWVNERTALLTLVALLVQPLFFIGAQFANLDMLVAGCITATVVLLAHAALCMETRLAWRRALAGAYLFAALGVLAKGLIGVVIPTLVVGAWLLANGRWRVMLRLLWLPGIAAFLLVAGPWFVLMQERFPEFFHYFIVVQHFQRFTQGGFNNVQPFWFYPAVLVLFTLPWLFWLYRQLRRREVRGGPQASVNSLMWLWLAMVVLFFSLPQSKLLGYVLPAVPPLSYLVASAYARFGTPTPTPTPREQHFWWASIGGAALLCLVAVAVLALYPVHSTRDIARALGAQRSANEPVVMLDDYYYDVPVYARLRFPIVVVADWDAADVPLHDNWRKEMADAAHFSGAVGKRNLLTATQIPRLLCRSPVSWVIASSDAPTRYPFLEHARRVVVEGKTTLWRFALASPAAVQSLGCADPSVR
ncbi:MAG: glycosyltransferase family 39 protein [Burkholderiaceae bacterium]